jgi:hypothetical protein
MLKQRGAFLPDHPSSIIDSSAPSLPPVPILLCTGGRRGSREKKPGVFGKREDFTKSPANSVAPSYPIIDHQSTIIDSSAPSATSCSNSSLHRREQRKQREETWRLRQNLAPSRLCVRSNKNQRRHVSTARIPRATPGKLHPKSASLDGLPVAVVPFRQSRGRAFHGEFRQQPLLLGNVSADN